MEQFYHLAHAFMHQDLATLSDPKMVFMVYVVLLTFLVLENGFIPTAFLPGDTLLILTGVLIYQGVLPMAVVPLLIMATFVGTWLGYMQGRFLGHTRMYHRLMSHLDDKHKEKVHYLLNKYGIITPDHRPLHRLCAYRLPLYRRRQRDPQGASWWST